MKFSDGLSAFRDRVMRTPALALPLDACHVGVVLRAVLWTQTVMAVAVMLGARNPQQWLERLALVSAGSVPAVLGWLAIVCVLARTSIAQRPPVMRAVAVGLGAVSGVQASALLDWIATQPEGAPWLASALGGGLLAAMLVAVLANRARSRAPADNAARLAGLQARIQPHFLFNTLNAAIALVRQDPARAEAVLEDLSDLFRQALAEPVEAVSVSEEVALARQYLRIEQVRFAERLQVHWTLDPRADDARVPPLMLQPLVENAVKHGVEPSERGAWVHIGTERRGDSVVITVTNSVPAGRGRPGLGVAQANVRERLWLLHDVRSQFQAIWRDGVYQVRMEVPA